MLEINIDKLAPQWKTDKGSRDALGEKISDKIVASLDAYKKLHVKLISKNIQEVDNSSSHFAFYGDTSYRYSSRVSVFSMYGWKTPKEKLRNRFSITTSKVEKVVSDTETYSVLTFTIQRKKKPSKVTLMTFKNKRKILAFAEVIAQSKKKNVMSPDADDTEIIVKAKIIDYDSPTTDNPKGAISSRSYKLVDDKLVNLQGEVEEVSNMQDFLDALHDSVG